ncbi:uncharacterized protein LOC144743491 [Ciona intestinalis]
MVGMTARTLVSCTFSNMVVRQHMNMNDGKIEVLQKGVFSDVRVSHTLRLDNNAIRLVEGPIFENSSYVYHLRLGYNELTTLPDDAFEDVTIRLIELRNNKFHNYPTALNKQQFSSIDLRSNSISSVIKSSFEGQTSLRHLILNDNKLSELKAGVFDHVPSLETLYLQNNEIDRIEAGVFTASLTRLRHITLVNNQLRHLPPFEGLPALQTLYLNDNLQLRTMDQNTFDQVADSVTEIRMQRNTFYCNCEVMRALYQIRKVVSGGQCIEPPAASGTLFDKTTPTSPTLLPDYFVTRINQTAKLFLCSGANVQGTTSASDCDITMTWEHPQYLYYDLNDTTSDLFGVDLAESVGCNSVNGTTSNSTTNVTKCGTSWTTEEDCLHNTILYNVSCTSASAPTVYNVTNSKTVQFIPVEPGTLYECNVVLHYNGTSSTFSETVLVQIQDAQGKIPATKSETNLWILPIQYYDFSAYHPDFDGLHTINPTNPSYVASPFGAWLTASANPATDAIASWFRSIPATNQLLSNTITLQNNATGGNNKYSFIDDTFYPLDGLGFRSESQRDCNGVLHNFGFVS